MRSVFILLSAVALQLARAQEPSFAESVYPILEKAGCAGCHNSNGVASATRLHFPERRHAGADRRVWKIAGDSGGPRPSREFAPVKEANQAGGAWRRRANQTRQPGRGHAHFLDRSVGASFWKRTGASHEVRRTAGEYRRCARAHPAPADPQPVQQYGRDLLGDQTAPAESVSQPKISSTASRTSTTRRTCRPCLEEATAMRPNAWPPMPSVTATRTI